MGLLLAFNKDCLGMSLEFSTLETMVTIGYAMASAFKNVVTPKNARL